MTRVGGLIAARQVILEHAAEADGPFLFVVRHGTPSGVALRASVDGRA
jgi:hypothetical protein